VRWPLYANPRGKRAPGEDFDEREADVQSAAQLDTLRGVNWRAVIGATLSAGGVIVGVFVVLVLIALSGVPIPFNAW
jgi:hypothetical protein